MSSKRRKEKELPSHEAAHLATIDYQYNAHRCQPESIAPRWIPDMERTTCLGCARSFDLVNRKHHCRYCGEIFCERCSIPRVLLPKEFDTRDPQRVCQSCHEKLLPSQKSFMKEFANHTRTNYVETESYFNLPFSKTLGSEIRKASCSIRNLLAEDLIQDTAISLSLLNNAKGIAFLTILKGGFIFAPRLGTGLVMSRLLDGRWSAPSAIASIGVSWGALIGIDVTDYIIVLHDLEAVRAFTTEGQVSLGGELKISVGGVGRTGAGELLVGDHGLATAVSYCHSKGLFAGISLDGALLMSRSEVNLNFYGRAVTPYQLLSGEISPPQAAACLYKALETATDVCDSYHGITSAERKHHDMMTKLDSKNMNQYNKFNRESKKQADGHEMNEEDDLSKGRGDQYY